MRNLRWHVGVLHQTNQRLHFSQEGQYPVIGSRGLPRINTTTFIILIAAGKYRGL